MCVDEFRRYIKAEREAIDEFWKSEFSKGRRRTRNDAALIWIEKYAEAFRKDYENKLRNDDG
jgi:hypothetical protein